MKRALTQSVLALTGAVAVGICFTGSAEAASLMSNRLTGRVVGFASSNSEIEAGQGLGGSSSTNISQILWSGIGSVDSFSVRLFTFGSTLPLATLTGNISSSVKPVKLYDDPTVVNVSFYTLSLDTPFSLNPGAYILSIASNSDWGWTKVDSGESLFRYGEADTWDEDNMSAGQLDLVLKSNTASNPTQPVPTEPYRV